MKRMTKLLMYTLLFFTTKSILSQDFPEIITPNGSETLYVGANYEIEWTGISPSDTVTIEYSLDRCSNWIMITEKATGLKYTWKNIPNTISNNCLLRIRKYKKFTAGIDNGYIQMTGHSGRTYGCAWSPNGLRIASAGEDGRLKIQNSVTNKLIKDIPINNVGIHNIMWSPNGNYIATAGRNNEAVIVDANTYKQKYVLKGHTQMLQCVAFSANECKLFATSGDDATIKIWNLESGSLITTLTGHTNIVHGIAWSPDGKYLASAGYDRLIKIWRVSDWTLVRTIVGHTSWIYYATWSPDSKYLASSSGVGDLSLRIWDASSGLELKQMYGHQDKINFDPWSADGEKLLGSSDDRTIRIWNIEDGKILKTYNENSGVYYAEWSVYKNRIVSSTVNGSVRIWEKDTLDFTEDISDEVWSIVPAPSKPCGFSAFDYRSFNLNTNVTLNEDSKLIDSSISLLKLQPFALGAVLNKSKVFFKNGFTTSFSFSSSNGDNNQNYDASLPGADGVTLVLQNNPSPVLGGRGGEIGYNGIPNAIALEIDTYRNGLDYNDANGNHIALQTTKDGKASSHHDNSFAINNDIFTLKDNVRYFLKMDYDAPKKHIDVYLDTNSNLLNKVLSVDNVNLDQLFGSNNGNCWIGITSASGVAFAEYFIHNWNYCEKDGSFISDVKEETNEIFPNQSEIYSEILVYNQIGQYLHSGQNVTINQLKASIKTNEPLFFYCKNINGSKNYKLIIE